MAVKKIVISDEFFREEISKYIITIFHQYHDDTESSNLSKTDCQEDSKISISSYDNPVDGKWLVKSYESVTSSFDEYSPSFSESIEDIIGIADNKEDLPKKLYDCTLNLAQQLAQEWIEEGFNISKVKIINNTKRGKRELKKSELVQILEKS